MSRLVFVIDCSDKRNEYMYSMLIKRSYIVTKLSQYNVFGAEDRHIFLFAPATRLTQETAKVIPNNSTIFCANCPTCIKEFLQEEQKTTVIDYFDDEPLAVRNAILTAEGALGAVIAKTDKALGGLSVLVLGGGRVGKATAKILQSNGTNVSIATRRNDEYALASLFASQVYRFSEIDHILHDFDVVVNTVPVRILGRERLALLKKNCFVLELASQPGGVDITEAELLGINSQVYLGIPGKIAPKTAAELLLDSVLSRI